MPETPTRINYAALARAAGQRRPVTLRPIFTTRQQERTLAAMYLRIVQVWEQGARDRILPVYGRSLAQYTGDSPADLQVEIGVVENNAIQAILSGFAAAYSDWFSDLVLWHINKIGSQLPYVDNITLRTQLGPARETLEDLLARNVALVRNVSDQTRGRISDIVFRGLQARTPSVDIGREIAEATGLGRKRSLRIAADQTVKASAALDRLRQEQLGFDRFVWKHSGKRHYRPEHRERDGKVFEWGGEVGRNDPPGFLPFCFPSEEPVGLHDDVFVFWRRFYRGHLTEFVTVTGEVVRCTPNHPILTTTGWKPAKSIDLSDKIVRVVDCGVDASDVDVKEAETAIGDMYEAFEALFGSVTSNGGGPDFHGDSIVDEKIDVVNIEGGLWNHVKAFAREDAVKVLLEKPLLSTLASRAPQLFNSPRFTTGARSVGRLDLIGSLLRAEFGPLKKTGLTIATDLHPVLTEIFKEGLTKNTERERDFIRRLSGFVGFDCRAYVECLAVFIKICELRDPIAKESLAVSRGVKVAHVKSYPWEGNVYNMETSSGWYSSNGLTVSNCGCHARAYLDPSEGG